MSIKIAESASDSGVCAVRLHEGEVVRFELGASKACLWRVFSVLGNNPDQLGDDEE